MALSFPRLMPAAGVGQQVFEPQRVDLMSPEASGRLGSISVGYPLWAPQWTLADALSQAQSDEWRAWIASLEGSARQFFGYEVGREFPRQYVKGFAGLVRPGGGAFDGSAVTWSQAITLDGQAILQLSGLPVGLKLSTGDYVDFRWLTGGAQRRSMVRSLEPATASGAGVASFAVMPPVPAVTPAGAIAHLDNPACIMRLVPQQTQITPMGRRKVAGARIAAVQDLLP